VAGVRAARAVVADLDGQRAVGPFDDDVDRGGLRVLGRVGERLGGDVVRGRLAAAREPVVGAQLDPDRQRRAPGQRADRRAEPGLGQDGRVQAAGQVPDLLARGGQPVVDLVHLGAQVGRDPVAEVAHQERQGDQVLLHAVVQVSFELAAHLVAHGQDPPARGGQLGRELLDLSLPPGGLLGVPFGLLPQLPFPGRLLPVQPADPGAERRDRDDQHHRGLHALGAADAELVVRGGEEVVEGQRGAHRRRHAQQPLAPGQRARRHGQQDQGDQHVAHVGPQRGQRERQQHRHDEGSGQPDRLPQPGSHALMMTSCQYPLPGHQMYSYLQCGNQGRAGRLGVCHSSASS
jgi:hypothetical protein